MVKKKDGGWRPCRDYEAMYGTAHTIPGEILDSPELPSSGFLSKIERAITGFVIPPPQHIHSWTLSELPASLVNSQFVFVCEEASIPSLALLYRSLYLAVEWWNKFFRLEI